MIMLKLIIVILITKEILYFTEDRLIICAMILIFSVLYLNTKNLINRELEEIIRKIYEILFKTKSIINQSIKNNIKILNISKKEIKERYKEYNIIIEKEIKKDIKEKYKKIKKNIINSVEVIKI